MNTLCQTGVTQVKNPNGVLESRTGAAVTSISLNEWIVVAHEIGHNFGALHDCSSALCPCKAPGCNTCCPCGYDIFL